MAKLKDLDVFSSGAISPNPELRPHKNFLRVCVENKLTVRDVRAIKHLVRRIRATDDARAFMEISFAQRVFSIGCRILLCGFLGSDWCCHRGATHTLRSRRNSNFVCASHLAHRRVEENQSNPTQCHYENNCQQFGFHVHN